MRTIEKGRGYFRGTHKGATIEIERDMTHHRRAFYIIVRWTDGGALYDGWAPESVRTMAQAKREARAGAMLDVAAKAPAEAA
ncbi:hypothetical protein sos41_11710 [Alphaproteobacteria bacterium SO-S41]|nr:hypothetical protein sos41_11710 [Alphaproteobacteria bacterium SO-S41]